MLSTNSLSLGFAGLFSEKEIIQSTNRLKPGTVAAPSYVALPFLKSTLGIVIGSLQGKNHSLLTVIPLLFHYFFILVPKISEPLANNDSSFQGKNHSLLRASPKALAN